MSQDKRSSEEPLKPKPAFEEFYEQERPRCRLWLLKISQLPEAEIDEIVDHAFAKMWQHWNIIDYPKSYLDRTLQNHIKDHFKAQGRAKDALEEYIQSTIKRDFEKAILVEEENLLALVISIAEAVLTPRELSIFRRYMYCGNLKEVSQQEGISHTNARQIWSQIRIKIKKHIQETQM